MSLQKPVVRPFLFLWLAVSLQAGGAAGQEQSPEAIPQPDNEDGWLVAVGDKMPDFELPDVDGTLHRLSDFSGRPAVLIFWGTW